MSQSQTSLWLGLVTRSLPVVAAWGAKLWKFVVVIRISILFDSIHRTSKKITWYRQASLGMCTGQFGYHKKNSTKLEHKQIVWYVMPPVKRLIMLAKNNSDLTFESQLPPPEVHIMGYIWGFAILSCPLNPSLCILWAIFWVFPLSPAFSRHTRWKILLRSVKLCSDWYGKCHA